MKGQIHKGISVWKVDDEIHLHKEGNKYAYRLGINDVSAGVQIYCTLHKIDKHNMLQSQLEDFFYYLHQDCKRIMKRYKYK